MPFTKQQKRSIPGDKKCLWCGWDRSFLDGVHLVDEIAQPKVNGVWLCKNCHAVFDDVFRPRLFAALVKYGVSPDVLPSSWKTCNKLRDPDDTGA